MARRVDTKQYSVNMSRFSNATKVMSGKELSQFIKSSMQGANAIKNGTHMVAHMTKYRELKRVK